MNNIFHIYNKVFLIEYIFFRKKLEFVKKLSKIEAVQTISAYNKPKGENNINIGNIQKYRQPLQRGGYLNLFEYGRYVHDHN